MTTLDYWIECVSIAAGECGAKLSDGQIRSIAEGVQGGHENYDMAFYSPPPSDRLAEVNREWAAKYKTLEQELESYKGGAEKAIRRSLKLYPDTLVSITKDGEVFRHGGRTEQIL